MVGLNATCGECGFENPRGWVACARCGHLLGPAIRNASRGAASDTRTTRRAPLPTGLEAAVDKDAKTALYRLEGEDLDGDVRPLLGQAECVAAIRRGVQQAFSEKRASLVALEGDTGSGKTRLLQRASEVAAKQAMDVRVLYAACRPMDDGPYAPFSRLLRNRFGIAPASSPTVVRGQMASLVAQVLGTSEAARIAETTHLLGHLMGVPFPDSPFLRGLSSNAEALHAAAVTALLRFLIGEARDRPLLLLLDDMGQAENGAWEMLEAVLHAQGPIAVVIAGRAPTAELARDLERIAPVHTASIAPLSEGEVIDFVRALVPRLTDLPAEFRTALRHRTQGNPRHLSEVLVVLQHKGLFVEDGGQVSLDMKKLEQGGLPVSLGDAVRARLGELDADQLRVMRHAAVVGERFWDGALLALVRHEREGELDADPVRAWSDIADEAFLSTTLRSLDERRLIVSIATSERPGFNEYTFQVRGARAAIYEELDPEQRSAAHAAVAGWLAMVPQLPVEEHSALLATQLEHAGQSDRAGRAYLEAAQSERQRMRNTMALRYAQRAIRLLDAGDIKVQIDTLHLLGSLLTVLGRYDEAHEAFTQLLKLAWRVAARGAGGAALNRIARIHRQRGEHAQAVEHLKAALMLFRAADDQPGVASTFDDLAQVHRLRGNLDPALAAAKEALEIRTSLRDKRGQAVSLNTLGHILLSRGDYATSELRFQTALKIRSSIGDHEGEVQSRIGLGRLAHQRGQVEEAVRIFREALEASREMDNRRFQTYLLFNLGEAYLGSGQLEGASAVLLEAKELAAEMRDQRALAEIERNLGLVALRRGDASAEPTLQAALALAVDYGTREALAHAHRAMGRLHARTLYDSTGAVVLRAEESFREGIRVFEECGNRPELARTEAELGYHLIERGELAEARTLLGRAHDRMKVLELPDLARVGQTLAELGA